MAKYLIQATYFGEGIKGLLQDGGSKRRAAVETMLKSIGGSIEAFYYAFGDTDLYAIGDFPDHASAAAMALTVASTGTVKIKTTVLLTPEEIDSATKLKPTFSPPGK
jgi:uncharacterized protein with GYD domain